MPSRRQERVCSRIVHEVSGALRELKDPRLGFVTITGADVSPDLRHATVLYSVFGDPADREATGEALERAASHLRRVVGPRLGLRVSPQLRFVYDRSLETSDRMQRLIAEARATDPNPGPPDEETEADAEGEGDGPPPSVPPAPGAC